MTTLETMDRGQLLAAGAALAPVVATHREALDEERRMPLPLVEALRAAGFFRLWLPAELGGAEADPEMGLALVETVAALDGAVGWNLLISMCGGLFAGYLPEQAARAIWSTGPDVFIAGSVMPTGRAALVAEGYRVSGRWSFVSGVQHAEWLCGNCIVFDGERPRLGANGQPDMRLLFFPATQAQVIDTWHTGGLRGTGSHDIAVDGIIVPEDYWFDVFNGRGRIKRPLYRLIFFIWFASGIAILTLGLARQAIDALTELAARKVPTGSGATLKERPLAQIQVAQAEALVLSARAFLLQAVRGVWASLVAGGEPTERELARLSLANVHAAESAVQAVELMYKAAGGSAVYSRSALDRCMRDVHVAAQHIGVSAQHYQSIGQTLLGTMGSAKV